MSKEIFEKGLPLSIEVSLFYFNDLIIKLFPPFFCSTPIGDYIVFSFFQSKNIA